MGKQLGDFFYVLAQCSTTTSYTGLYIIGYRTGKIILKFPPIERGISIAGKFKILFIHFAATVS